MYLQLFRSNSEENNSEFIWFQNTNNLERFSHFQGNEMNCWTLDIEWFSVVIDC